MFNNESNKQKSGVGVHLLEGEFVSYNKTEDKTDDEKILLDVVKFDPSVLQEGLAYNEQQRIVELEKKNEKLNFMIKNQKNFMGFFERYIKDICEIVTKHQEGENDKDLIGNLKDLVNENQQLTKKLLKEENIKQEKSRYQNLIKKHGSGEALCRACETGKYYDMKLLLKYGAKATYRRKDSDGYNALDILCEQDPINLEAIKYLLEYMPEDSINSCKYGDKTPLMIACKNESVTVEAIQFLIKNGANVTRRTSGMYETALHYACQNTNIDFRIIELLHEKGGRLFQEDLCPKSPICYAFKNFEEDKFNRVLSLSTCSATTCAIYLLLKGYDSKEIKEKLKVDGNFHVVDSEMTNCRKGGNSEWAFLHKHFPRTSRSSFWEKTQSLLQVAVSLSQGSIPWAKESKPTQSFVLY